MPEQFIKVKCSDNPSSTIYFTETIKKQESVKYGSSSNISNSNGDICRICHCEADVGNPLLSPCYCSGSLKYVHQTCLQQWLAASDTRACELCKFNFILHTKIKPISEWRRLEMSSVERRRLLCAILFHFVAAVCVVWSLFVLIDRATEEVQKGLIAWPFWTKLVVVAVGFTGGAVFMYIQCRQYLHLFSRWKAHNRIILVQNAPEKPTATIPSPNFTIPVTSGKRDVNSHVVANIECNEATSPHPAALPKGDRCASFVIHKTATDSYGIPENCMRTNTELRSISSADALDRGIQEILALDVDCSFRKTASSNLDHTSKTDSRAPNTTVFKSLPNLSASSENLLI